MEADIERREKNIDDMEKNINRINDQIKIIREILIHRGKIKSLNEFNVAIN